MKLKNKSRGNSGKLTNKQKLNNTHILSVCHKIKIKPELNFEKTEKKNTIYKKL